MTAFRNPWLYMGLAVVPMAAALGLLITGYRGVVVLVLLCTAGWLVGKAEEVAAREGYYK